MNTTIPIDWRKFLLCKDNKQLLIDTFSFLLMKDGIKVKHDGDADTLIIKEALTLAVASNVIVHSVDTDIFIALLHHNSNADTDLYQLEKLHLK